MVLGFHERFKEPILNGTKIHTIRRNEHSEWKAGCKIEFATVGTTSNYRQFDIGRCFDVQQIKFEWYYLDKKPICLVSIDGVDISGNIYGRDYACLLSLLAKNDGFDSIEGFLSWRDWAMRDYVGTLIHWTPFRYCPSRVPRVKTNLIKI
jgi:hypothetical protein